MKRFLISFLGIIFLFTYSYVSNPKQLNIKQNYKILKSFSPQIHHIKSPMDLYGGWTCGYFCLYNAAKLEQNLNLLDKNLKFKEACNKYLKPHKVNPRDSSGPEDLLTIADEHLGLHNIYVLTMNADEKIQLLKEFESYDFDRSANVNKVEIKANTTRHSIHVDVTGPLNISPKQLEAICKKEQCKQLSQELENLKRQFQSNSNPATLHFICHIKDEQHWILMSLVKQNSEKPMMLIYDNCNFAMSYNPERQEYVDQISKMFFA